MQKLRAKSVWWVSRLDLKGTLYLKAGLGGASGKELDLRAYLRKVDLDGLELEVIVGEKGRLEGRLLAVGLPKGVVEQRLPKIRRTAPPSGYTLSQRKREGQAYNVYLTNLGSEQAGAAQIVLL